jgi:hypothetical protein
MKQGGYGLEMCIFLSKDYSNVEKESLNMKNERWPHRSSHTYYYAPKEPD